VISVSWIKKIMNKLSDHDESYEELYEEEVEEREPRSEKRILNNRVVNHAREVEARMTYQYPKGNFRFPLISDGEKVNEPRPERKRRDPGQRINREPQREEVKGHERKQRKSPLQKPDRPEPSSSARQNEKNDKQAKKPQKVEKGNSRPFRPTEIPSPIYGFRTRPVKPVKKDEVEYELGEFLHNGEAGVKENLSVYPPDLKEVKEMADESWSPNQSVIEASLVGNEFSFKENVEQDQTEDLHGQKPARTEASSEMEPKETESAGSQPEYSNAPIYERSSASPLMLAENEAISEAAAAQEVPLAVPDELEQQEQEEPLQYKETKQPAESMHHREAGHPESLVQNQEPKHPEPNVGHKEGNQPEESAQHQENELQPGPLQNQEEEPKQRKRSHLPFNVLMLKQDKRQMNHRNSTMSGPDRNTESSSSPDRGGRTQAASFQQQKQDQKNEKVQGEEAVKSYSELSSSVKSTKGYTFPEMDYLMPPVSKKLSGDWLESQKHLLDETLHNFNVRAKVVNVTQGPSVTRFEVQPEPGVKVNKITNLSDDIKLSLAAKDIRIEAPIPGKHTIGIEVPNRESRPVCISEVIASPAFQESESSLTAALGLDISGQPIVTDLSKMPHGLIAGATGSGKSVCINSILVSLLYKASPDELKLLLIDPKMVELAPYNRIPHLVSPVITDVKAATAALKWAVEEMERRYELFAHTGVRDIKRFNELANRNKQYNDRLPYLVIVIDELADLMMMSPADVEEAICRIAQKARACGIHLIIATQRPSVDVITGLIKANVPTRVAFSVSSGVDSRTIIDGSGAERLLGKGDMLFLENGSSKPVRLQGTFVSDDEIDDIINHVREQREPDYIFQQDELIKKAQVTEEEDELFFEACEFVIDQGGASASSLQRRFRIGYNRAARLMEMMEKSGVISESRGSKPRDILISESELETLA
jgi:DNA segregation ATPase FtsK/SpoIIIE, S-DNA-T family